MKINILRIVAISFILFSCSNDDHTPVQPGEDLTDDLAKLTDFQRDVVEYFPDIALGFEFGTNSEITRKWTGPMKVYVNGAVTPELEAELDGIISEIEDLATDGLSIEIVNTQSESNYHIFFGSGDAYANIYPDQSSLVQNNWGLFSVFWGGSNNLIRGHMYVDTERADETAQLHLLREEFTQSLGLAKDSDKYSDSIFQSAWTTTTSYADIDKELIRLLYHPRIGSGLAESQVELILVDILLKE